VDSAVETFASFAELVRDHLEIQVFTRLGMRCLYVIECKSLQEAQEKAQAAAPNSVPRKQMFSIRPNSVSPTFKTEVDDGELGYNAQIYAREQKMDFAPPPDAIVAGLEKVEKQLFHLILDLDFYSKKPMASESFDTKSWLMGWNKAITRDADAFLDLAGGRS
jgi:hypothetical protein